MEILQSLLPHFPWLQLETCKIDNAHAQISLTVCSRQDVVRCPLCYMLSSRIHGHYERTIADLPWGEYRVTWQLLVRKFVCSNPNCQRHIFTERLVGIVAPWARKTQRLSQQLLEIGLALGGAAGARLSECLGLSTSRDTLLRVVRQTPLPPIETPKVLGVDDWAFRKGRTYRTILVDLQKGQPIALLPDREAETLTQWLKDHPGVEVISRDRAKGYKRGATQGAPDTIQVADRFHLLKNLAEAVEQFFSDHRQDLKIVEEATLRTPAPQSDGSVVVPVPPPPTPGAAETKAQQRRAKRLAIYRQVRDLRKQRWSGRAIAQKLSISKTTVFRYLQSTQFPERKGRSDRGCGLLDPYKTYILERWNAGMREVKQLFHELQRQGYCGSYVTVTHYAQRLRLAQGLSPRQRAKGQSLPKVVEPKMKSLSVRSVTWLVLRRPENRDQEDEQLLAQLQAQHPHIASAIELAQDFAQLVRTRSPEQLDPWLLRTLQSPLGALVRFAQGITDDYAAVKAGVTLPWSNGPVEGHNNRLKMVKRQMYGRANLDLLSRRLLLAS